MESYSLLLLVPLLCISLLSVETTAASKSNDKKTIVKDFLYQAADKEIISKLQLSALMDLIEESKPYIRDKVKPTTQDEAVRPATQEEVRPTAQEVRPTTQEEIHNVTTCTCTPPDLSSCYSITDIFVFVITNTILFIISCSALGFATAILKKYPALNKPEHLEIAVLIGFLAVGKFIGTVFGGSIWFYWSGIAITNTSANQKPKYRDITIILRDFLLQKKVPKQADFVSISCLGLKLFTVVVMSALASNSLDVLAALACFMNVNGEIRRSRFTTNDQSGYFTLTQMVTSIIVWIAFLVLDHSHFLVIVNLAIPVTIIQVLDNYNVYQTKSLQYTGILAAFVISEYLQYTILYLISYALLLQFVNTMTADEDRVTMSCGLAITVVVVLSHKLVAIVIIAGIIITAITAFLCPKTTPPNPPTQDGPVECIICTDPPVNPLLSPCCQRIVGCSACVERWMATSNTCPHCNSRVSHADFQHCQSGN